MLIRAAAGVGIGLAATLAAIPALGPDAAAVAVGLYVAVAALASAFIADTHPHARLGIANAITVARAGGTAVFAALTVNPAVLATPTAAWSVCSAAAMLLVLDGLDGLAARSQGLASDFGARFDMEIDALFVLILSVLALRTGVAGAWVLAIGLARYGFVAAGAIWPALGRPLPPSRRRKLVCGCVIVALAALFAPPVAPAGGWIAGGALVAVSASFAADIRWLVRGR